MVVIGILSDKLQYRNFINVETLNDAGITTTDDDNSNAMVDLIRLRIILDNNYIVIITSFSNIIFTLFCFSKIFIRILAY